jgi:hypothetical protein
VSRKAFQSASSVEIFKTSTAKDRLVVKKQQESPRPVSFSYFHIHLQSLTSPFSAGKGVSMVALQQEKKDSLYKRIYSIQWLSRIEETLVLIPIPVQNKLSIFTLL